MRIKEDPFGTGAAASAEMLEALLLQPYQVIDFLPARVPENCPGQFFAVEQYFLQGPRGEELYQKFADILLKLNCYFDFAVFFGSDEDPVCSPEPEKLNGYITSEEVRRGGISILLPGENMLITLNGYELYMTVYGLSERTEPLVRALTEAEGLFLRDPGRE